MARKGWAADARLWIRSQHCDRGVLIIARVTFWLKSVRTTAILANIRLIRDLPINDIGSSFAIMPHEARDELFPLAVIIWFDDILIDIRKERPWFETNAHKRSRSCSDDRSHGSVQFSKFQPICFR